MMLILICRSPIQDNAAGSFDGMFDLSATPTGEVREKEKGLEI